MRQIFPFIDVHSVDVDVNLEDTWRGLIRLLGIHGSAPAWSLLSAILGCSERHHAGALEELGSTLPGFRVTASRAPSLLRLEGRHRFSEYALEFRLRSLGSRLSQIAAESRAAFPGPLGVAYRTVVVGSHAHALAMRQLLLAAKRMGEAEHAIAAA